MGLHLSDRKLRQLQELTAQLAAPFDFAGRGAWASAISRDVGRLFDADGVIVILPAEAGRSVFRFHGIGPELARELRDCLIGSGSQTFRFRYPKLEQLMSRLAGGGVRVWTPELAERLTRIPIEEMAYTHEVVVPHGIHHQANLAVPFPDGPGLIGFFHRSPERDPFGDDRLALLHLLLPSFRNGVRTLGNFARARAAIERELEAHPDGILLFDADRRPIFRNRAATLLLDEQDRRTLLAHVEALAGRLCSLRTPPRKHAPDPPRRIEEKLLRLGASQLSLSASFLPAGLVERRWVVLVRVTRLTPSLPAAEVISERFGLTPRQAQVARLIAEDCTSPEIAERLGISVHTVERHAERVLRVLGLRSRKGLGAHLLGHR